MNGESPGTGVELGLAMTFGCSRRGTLLEWSEGRDRSAAEFRVSRRGEAGEHEAPRARFPWARPLGIEGAAWAIGQA
jgi:hypothetical protein